MILWTGLCAGKVDGGSGVGVCKRDDLEKLVETTLAHEK